MAKKKKPCPRMTTYYSEGVFKDVEVPPGGGSAIDELRALLLKAVVVLDRIQKERDDVKRELADL